MSPHKKSPFPIWFILTAAIMAAAHSQTLAQELEIAPAQPGLGSLGGQGNLAGRELPLAKSFQALEARQARLIAAKRAKAEPPKPVLPRKAPIVKINPAKAIVGPSKPNKKVKKARLAKPNVKKQSSAKPRAIKHSAMWRIPPLPQARPKVREDTGSSITVSAIGPPAQTSPVSVVDSFSSPSKQRQSDDSSRR